MLPIMTYDRITTGSDQTLRTVCRAELARLVRQGGNRSGLLLSIGFGLLAGLTALAILSYLSSGDADGATSLNVTVPMEVTISVTAVLLSLTVVGHYWQHSGHPSSGLPSGNFVEVRLFEGSFKATKV